MPNSGLEENQLNVQGYNIVSILKRLESATSRLEDITIFQEEGHRATQAFAAAVQDAAGGSNAAKSVEEPPKEKKLATPAPEEAKFVKAFQEFIKTEVDPFVATSATIDPVVADAANLLKAAFVEQASFLNVVSKSKKPDLSDPAFVEALGPTQAKIMAIGDVKDAGRRSEFFNHLNTLSDGAAVLGWVVTDTPVSSVAEFKDNAQFWANRVMKDFRDKDPKHSEWVKQFSALFDALRAYVKEYHTTGPAWNPSGKPLAESLAAAQSTPSPTDKSAIPSNVPAPSGVSGGAPPPPPPPPAPPANLFDEPAASSGGLNAVFADLNKGSDVTAGLKKVDKSQMTHKNPSLRQQPTLARKPTPPKKPTSLTSKTNVPQGKPPRKELVDGQKWVIENFTEADVTEPIVIEVEKTQSVFIGKTSGITIQIKGKGNAVSISETSKTGVVVDSLISSVDVIKSFKFGVQVTGVVPIITVDKCEEGSVYLSQESVDSDTQIVSSNTTALNINVLEGDDYIEIPVPEQLSHSIKNGKLVSEVVEHAG